MSKKTNHLRVAEYFCEMHKKQHIIINYELPNLTIQQLEAAFLEPTLELHNLISNDIELGLALNHLREEKIDVQCCFLLKKGNGFYPHEIGACKHGIFYLEQILENCLGVLPDPKNNVPVIEFGGKVFKKMKIFQFDLNTKPTLQDWLYLFLNMANLKPNFNQLNFL